MLCCEDVDVGSPAAGEAVVRHTAIGVNFIDTYHRSGLYPQVLPATLGMEAAGVVEAVGAGVDVVHAGQRVAYAGGPIGAYAELRRIPADRLVPLPDAIADDVAAAVMLKGMTAQYLLRQTYEVKPGDTVLFHAAAGGVGLIACAWAKRLGATVIGTVGSDEKAALARAHGCDHVIVYTREDFVSRVREITGGRGVRVVYDSVGRSTWDGSLDCLQPRGLMVSFGNASGPGAADLAARARGEGLALPHPADADDLHGDTRRAARLRKRAVRRARDRGRDGPRERPLPARGRRAGAPRPRVAAHDRVAAAQPLETASPAQGVSEGDQAATSVAARVGPTLPRSARRHLVSRSVPLAVPPPPLAL